VRFSPNSDLGRAQKSLGTVAIVERNFAAILHSGPSKIMLMDVNHESKSFRNIVCQIFKLLHDTLFLCQKSIKTRITSQYHVSFIAQEYVIGSRRTVQPYKLLIFACRSAVTVKCM